MTQGLVIILVVCCIFFIIKTFIDYSDAYYVKSSIDSKEYLIRNKYTTPSKEQQTVDALAMIYKEISKMIFKMEKDTNKPYWLKYLSNFTEASISEAAIDKQYTTYTVDKKHIHICLRSRDSKQELYDMNDLLYVVIHELAHMVNYTQDGEPITGHGIDFQLKFKYLINEAINVGIYKYYDYSKEPKDYCGMQITSHILN